MTDNRMPNEVEARGFKTAVLAAAVKYLNDKPALDRSCFDVRVHVSHSATATENLDEYFGRNTGDEVK